MLVLVCTMQVRKAAPYCLHAAWSPEVDKEMVVLQVRAAVCAAHACVCAHAFHAFVCLCACCSAELSTPVAISQVLTAMPQACARLPPHARVRRAPAPHPSPSSAG